MQLFSESVSRLFPPNVAEGDEILRDDGNAANDNTKICSPGTGWVVSYQVLACFHRSFYFWACVFVRLAVAAAGKETNSSSEDISTQMCCNSSDAITHLCVNWHSILPNSCDDGQPS
jgi:hypothetical protein